MKDIIRRLHDDTMNGNSESKEMMSHLRQRYYCLNLAAQLQAFIHKCQTFFRSKLIAKHHLRPPLQKIYDPSNEPEDLLEIDLVRPFRLLTVSRTLLQQSTCSQSTCLLSPWDRPTHNRSSRVWYRTLPDTRTSRTPYSQQRHSAHCRSSETNDRKAGVSIKHAAIKHAQTISMIERTHQKMRSILKSNISGDQP